MSFVLETLQKKFGEDVLTVSVPDAGKVAFGMERGASYEAAIRGDIPVIQIGKLKRVSMAWLVKILEQAA